MKKFLLVLAALMLAAQTVSAKFYDISEDEAKDKIEYLAEKGIINGTGDNMYTPERLVTRAEFAAMAVRAMGYKGTGENKFSDISDPDWFYKDVLAAENAGVISGFPDGTFKPYENITHEQAVKLLVNIYEKNYATDPAGDMATMFDDYYDISDWARESVSKGTMLSIARGYDKMTVKNNDGSTLFGVSTGNGGDENNFSPKMLVNRSQAADMLYALIHSLEITGKVNVMR